MRPGEMAWMLVVDLSLAENRIAEVAGKSYCAFMSRMDQLLVAALVSACALHKHDRELGTIVLVGLCA